MKMVLQKRTSKCVVNLLNGLGIVASVSLTACKKEKGEQKKNDIDGSVSFEKNDIDGSVSFKENDIDGSDKIGANEAILKILDEGKVLVVDGYDGKESSLVLNSIDNLQKFVDFLKNKEKVRVDEGTWRFDFFNGNVEICRYLASFQIPGADRFEDFLDCLSSLSKFRESLEISKLIIDVGDGEVKLGGRWFNGVYYKSSDFWNLVRKHADLFEIRGCKFKIENNGGFVAIKGFGRLNSFLNWEEIVGDVTIKSEWDKIFEFESVAIVWRKDGIFYIDSEEKKSIDSLNQLLDINRSFYCKNVIVGGGEFKLDFLEGGNFVKVCGGEKFDIGSNDNFGKLLLYISYLKKKKAISDSFTIKIGVVSEVLWLGETMINKKYVGNIEFWNFVIVYKDLFGGLPIKVFTVKNSRRGKIGKIDLEFDVFDDEGDIDEVWKDVFIKE